MKTLFKFAIMASVAVLAFIVDISPQSSRFPAAIQMMPEAHAVLGVRRRSRRRGAAVGYAAGASAAHSQDAAAAQSQPAAAAPPPAAPPPSYGDLPLGTVVSALPSGCTTETAGGVEYYHCGPNYFRAVFQGNNLVYVSADPGKS